MEARGAGRVTGSDLEDGNRAAGRLAARRSGALWGALLLLAMSAGGCAPGPDVLIVVLDACRADKLGCYGHPRPTSPALDELAADPDAVVFRRHYVQASWTRPSTASLFTGTFMHQHRVGQPRDGVGTPSAQVESLGPGFETMAELFSRAGYSTVAVHKAIHLQKRYGMDQGFSSWHDDQESDQDIIWSVLSLVESIGSGFFGYAHLGACHHPFKIHERDAGFMEEFGFDYDEEARRQAGVDFTRPAVKFAIRDGQLALGESDERFLHLVYEAQLRRVDRLMEELIQGLRKLSRYDDMLIVVTADHGEELYDHGGYAHSGGLWEEVIHVPLIVKFPRGTRPPQLGGQVDALTRSVDLLPALLDVVGADAPEGLPGRRIFRGEFADFALAETDLGYAILRDGFKLVDTPGQTLLFDLSQPPGDRVDRSAALPERVASLRGFAAELFATPGDFPVPPGGDSDLDERTRQELRSLGYIR